MNSAPSVGAAIPRRDSDQLIRKITGPILNRHLSAICQLNGLKSTGVKADMQQRIVNREFGLHSANAMLPLFQRLILSFQSPEIQEAIKANDPARFQHIRSSIEQTIANRSAPSQPPSSGQSYGLSTPSSTLLHYSNQYPQMPKSSPSIQAPREYPLTTANGHRYGMAQTTSLTFVPSPFYRVETTIGDVRVCDSKK